MNTNIKTQIKNIFKKVMYLDNDFIIEDDKSLFLVYDMSSVDFIDFSFELKKEFANQVNELHIWPIKSLMSNEQFFLEKENEWTKTGLDELNKLLNLNGASCIFDKKVTNKDLMHYFTVEYLANFFHKDIK